MPRPPTPEQIAWAQAVWARFNVAVDDDGLLIDDWRPVEAYHAPSGDVSFPAGTDREDVWHWIEERSGVAVAFLMGLTGDPTGQTDTPPTT